MPSLSEIARDERTARMVLSMLVEPDDAVTGGCCMVTGHRIRLPLGGAWKDGVMVKPYPQEFREDVVRVARGREPGVSLAQVAKDFGVHEVTLSNWLKKAAIEDGTRPGQTAAEAAEVRQLRRRNRLLEQENEVLRRAAAYLSQANLPGK